ncbi:MAG TPA: hypothetical protein PKG83_02840 [bacterium]|jgi:hypothetical protein|nr:hypothetical protein [bacterium]
MTAILFNLLGRLRLRPNVLIILGVKQRGDVGKVLFGFSLMDFHNVSTTKIAQKAIMILKK